MSYFVTGFPGFIATRLVRSMSQSLPEERFELLVHPSQMSKARHAIEELESSSHAGASRFIVVEGDITVPGLGLEDRDGQRLRAEVTRVFHLAAIYDLAVGKEIAEKVNVQGTQNVTDWVRTLAGLKRYVYFSTAYVSGNRMGTVLETELIDINGFKNFYESTKFRAEAAVRRAWDDVPTTIIRPGVVMGDSLTGETDKFDGPYFVMRFLDKFSRLPIPYLGKGDALFNVVPVDFVVNATSRLAHFDGAEHRTYHLSDPSPRSAREAYGLICRTQLGITPKYTIPLALVAAALSVRAFRRWVGVEKETLEYFRIGPQYDCSQATADLASVGVSCPDLADYIGTAVTYFLSNRHDSSKIIEVD